MQMKLRWRLPMLLTSQIYKGMANNQDLTCYDVICLWYVAVSNTSAYFPFTGGADVGQGQINCVINRILQFLF